MFPRLPTHRRLVVASLLACVAAAGAFAQGTSRSPFLPPQAAGGATPTQGAPLEFRAYMSTNEGTLYRIYDPGKKAGVWVKLNERNPDFDVIAKQHNEDNNTLTVEHGGRTLTLAVREAKVVSGGGPGQMAPPPQPTPLPAPAANVAPAVTQSVVLNPTPADEQRRLEAVAAEVARRRALREQAAQQVNQPAPQAPTNAPQPAPANSPQRR